MTTTDGKCPICGKPGWADCIPPSEAPSGEGPYKHTWDAGIKRHVLSGPGIDSSDERYHFGLRLEVEPIADDLNFAFVQGAKSREEEIGKMKTELLGLYSQCSGCQALLARWNELRKYVSGVKSGISISIYLKKFEFLRTALLEKMDELEGKP